MYKYQYVAVKHLGNTSYLLLNLFLFECPYQQVGTISI